MLPEAARAAVTRAATLWGEMEGLYDEIDTRMASGSWASIDEAARHLDQLQGELAPLVSTLAAARVDRSGGAEIDHAWSAMTERGRALATRRQDLERRVVEARDAVEAELARVRRGRSQTRSYSPPAALAPRFTSRRI